jgi:CRISPR type IV-associated protein Csf2
MKKTVSIHAILTTISPLHITSPESFRYEIDAVSGYGRVNNGTVGGISCSGIQRRRFAPGAGDDLKYGIPVIAANNLAGGLRRQAAQVVFDVLRAKKERVALSTYSALTCGAVTGKPDMRDLTYKEYIDSAKHPYAGLLGGGPRLLRRRMQVLDALPVMQTLRDGGYTVKHPSGSGRNVDNPSALTSAACFRRGDDVSALLDVDRMSDVVTEFEAQFNARQALIIEDQAKKDADEKGSRNSTKTWSAFEFVMPGVDFDFTINLVDVTDAQIGLFLLSLDGLVKGRIGGQSRNGLGRIALKDVVISKVSQTGKTVSDTIFNNNSLITSNEEVAGYLAAWSDAAKEMSAADLDAMMKPPVIESDEEKTAKAEAKAAKKASKVKVAA